MILIHVHILLGSHVRCSSATVHISTAEQRHTPVLRGVLARMTCVLLFQTTFHKLRGARGDRIRLFMLSLRAASRELNLFLALLFIFTAAFAFIIRLVESSENIESTPQALWWALVTLTTIGFGGGGPQSILGYLAGVSAAVTGLIVAGILLPTLGARYLELSEHYEAIKRVRRREQQQQRASNDIAVNGKAK